MNVVPFVGVLFIGVVLRSAVDNATGLECGTGPNPALIIHNLITLGTGMLASAIIRPR